MTGTEPAWTEALAGRARDWVADDPDPQTRHQLAELIDAAEGGDADAIADIADRFAADLEFGTAGLRGALGPGPNRMNLAVVIRAAAGIATWLRDTEGDDGARRGVAIGFDHRHRSRDFAEASAEVFAAAGIRAHLLPGPNPTPVLAFAVAHLGTAAGVMVTASHNPPQDNGYKVYDGSARQIVPPTDTAIATAMAEVRSVSAVPRAATEDPDIQRLGPEVADAYLAAAHRVGLVPSARTVRVAYTAMHGVGAATVRSVFAEAGFDPVIEVAEQVEPDPDFPTVSFPNPEEPGALDLGKATAARSNAQVLLANDPDADRLGAAVPDPVLGPGDDPGGWRTLRGDEIGVLLAHHLLTHHGVAPDAILATTIVSSTLLGRMAAAADVPFVETLTGFKWLGRAPREGQALALGYEEALGYCVGGLVRDKDGITAALTFAEAVAVLAEQGRTVLDVLDDLARQHGVHLTGQWSPRLEGAEGLARIAQAMVDLRANPPKELAGRAVTDVVDLIDGDSAAGLAPSDVVMLHLDGARVVVRPSGTEPKLKTYLEVVTPVVDGDLDAARTQAQADLDALTTAVEGAIDLG